jgi:two-component system, cell cycle sensor histidine kinase and response regulator CckA
MSAEDGIRNVENTSPLAMAETALRDSHTRYKGIFENTRDGIAVYEAVDNGKDFVFVEFNPAGERIEQIDRKEVIGRRVTEVFPAVKDFGLLEVFQRVWRTGIAESHPVSIYKDGRINGWRENFVYKLPAGEIVAVYSDETQRKQVEEALRESEEKYRVLVENAGEVVLVAQDKRVAFVNRTITRMTGYLPEDLFGKPFVDYIHPDDRATVVERHVQRLQGEAVPRAYPFRIITKAGEIRHVEGHIVPIEWEGRPATLNLLADITDRREAEAANEKWQAQLYQAQRMESIGVLAGGVAHEFNNLLTTIIGNAQLALADLPEESPVCEDIREIKKAGDRGALLTRRLMTFSRREVFHPEPLNLNHLIHDMETLVRRLIRENIALQFALEEGLWEVVADPVQMEQVVMNLATNAMDVMLDGGTLTIETANRYLEEAHFAAHDVDEAPGRYVMLAVTDTGAGMDQATLERIFEPFFTTKETGTGTGLGLPMVYGIVKQSRGYIWPYSEPGTGTTMKIYLPAAEKGLVREKEDPVTAPRAKGETVLVAEDDAALMDLAVKALRKAGYRVLTAKDGQEALGILERFEGRIHLLLADMVMPRMGGRELAGRARALRQGIQVLYMSGYPIGALFRTDRMDRESDFIEKPFATETLCQKVRKALGARKSERGTRSENRG